MRRRNHLWRWFYQGARSAFFDACWAVVCIVNRRQWVQTQRRLLSESDHVCLMGNRGQR